MIRRVAGKLNLNYDCKGPMRWRTRTSFVAKPSPALFFQEGWKTSRGRGIESPDFDCLFHGFCSDGTCRIKCWACNRRAGYRRHAARSCHARCGPKRYSGWFGKIRPKAVCYKVLPVHWEVMT